MSSAASSVSSAVSSAAQNVGNRVENGTLLGNSVWGRAIGRWSGGVGTSNVVSRWRQQLKTGGNNYAVRASDVRDLSASRAYSSAGKDVAAAQAIADQAVQAGIDANYQKQADAEATKARLANEVRVRRRGLSEQPGNKNGTLLTGALGLPGTGTASRLLGA